MTRNRIKVQKFTGALLCLQVKNCLTSKDNFRTCGRRPKRGHRKLVVRQFANCTQEKRLSHRHVPHVLKQLYGISPSAPAHEIICSFK